MRPVLKRSLNPPPPCLHVIRDGYARNETRKDTRPPPGTPRPPAPGMRFRASHRCALPATFALSRSASVTTRAAAQTLRHVGLIAARNSSQAALIGDTLRFFKNQISGQKHFVLIEAACHWTRGGVTASASLRLLPCSTPPLGSYICFCSFIAAPPSLLGA